jgi:hypothetical protein
MVADMGVNNSFSTVRAYSGSFGSAVSLNRFSKWDDNTCLGQPCGIAPRLLSDADSFRAMALVDEDISNYFATMTLSTSQDTDNDNMTDTWEWENGLNGFVSSDGVTDLDLDGWSNIQEFYGQTDPRNALSFPVAGAGDYDSNGINDPEDAFPFDPNETVDSDNDKIGNNTDLDDDGDCMDDDLDDDNDGIADVDDPFPLVVNTVPPPPVINAVDSVDSALQVRFSPNGDGGASIIDYTLTCGDTSVTSSKSPIKISELENDVSYTCPVTARNILGNSLASESVGATPEETIRSGLNIPLLKAILDAQTQSQ